MNKTHTAMVLALAMLFGSPASAQTADGDKAIARDRMTYNRLIAEIAKLDRDYEAAFQQSMREARADGGRAKQETKARILAIRDQRDRKCSRANTLALRHGWATVPINPDPAEAAVPQEPPTRQVFRHVDVMILDRFAEEALQIARSVDLPVVSFDKER